MPDRTENPLAFPPPGLSVSERRQGPERRAQGRVPFTAAAQACELRTGMRVNGRCSDISAGGCYIDTLTPLTLGAKVKVRIECESRVFKAQAVVAYAHVSMGMGVTFTEIEPQSREVLRSWIGLLGGEETSEDALPPGLQAEKSGERDVQMLLEELVGLLVRKGVLTDEEAARFLGRESPP
jgi:hypothetical protein